MPNKEILVIAEKIRDVYVGNPWFGRSAIELLDEVEESFAFEKPSGQHSILELLWHMNIWKEFTISRLHPGNSKNLQYFDANDWQVLDHLDKNLWKEGLTRFHSLQAEFLMLVEQKNDELLSEIVPEKKYEFRKLLYGAIDHDIYHLGQIAFITKMMRKP